MTIFLNGTIHTMDPARPRVEAVACADGRVSALGGSAELRALAGAGAEIVDLGGRVALPGLIDAHLHLLSLGEALGRINLDGERSLAACVQRVVAAQTEGAGWIRGRGWNQNDWVERRWPTRQDLAAITRRPVALNSKDGHLLWVNDVALAAAGITRETPDPAGGEIARDERGEPTGVLKEHATDLVYSVIPEPSDVQIEAALERACEHLLALGLTGAGNFEGPRVLRALGRLRARGRLRLRVTQHIAFDALDAAIAAGLFSGLGDEWLRVGALKLFADGTLGSQTAAMLEPFEGSPDNRGIVTLPYEQIYEAAARAAGAGIATAIHAIGDGANRAALRALSSQPRVAGMPHRIEHAQLLHPDDVGAFARHGIVASMQPIHAIGDRDTADQYWGARCATAYAWRALQQTGATLAFGSDAPVESADPLAGLFAAVARRGRHDGREAWRPEQALSLHEAVAAYTLGAAAASGEKDAKGMLAAGRLADLVVLSGDPFAGLDTLEQTQVVATVVGGRVVAGAL